MLYKTQAEWLAAPRKRVLFFGMSGLGKTYLASMLRGSRSPSQAGAPFAAMSAWINPK